MLRALVVVLALANLVFFGWSLGWLDDIVGIRARGDREPERLASQVRADSIVVIPSAAPTRTTIAPPKPACLEAGPFAPTEIAAAEAALQSAAPNATWTDVRTERQGTWLVYLGSYPDRDALQRKSDELHRLHLDAEEVAVPGESPFGLALGRVEGRTNAEHALAQFMQRGVRTARLLPLSPRSVTHTLRIEKTDPAVAAQLAGTGGVLGKAFVACATVSAVR